MVLVVPATNRRENCFVCTNSARSATFRKWVGPQSSYVSRSTSRHSPILVGFYNTIGKVGRKMWPGKPCKKSTGAGLATRESILVRGFDSTPFRPIWCPGGSIFSIWGCSPGSLLFSILYPYSPGVAVLGCVLIFVPLCRPG